jgi:Uma2 family endonuclease
MAEDVTEEPRSSRPPRARLSVEESRKRMEEFPQRREQFVASITATPAPRRLAKGAEQVDRAAAGTVSAQQMVLDGISWRTYGRLLRAFDDRHVRLTYDRGDLEIMTLSPEHERFKHLLGLLIGVLVEELGWNMAGFGSMTFRSARQRRGLEPDECYWIQNEPRVRGKDRIDLRQDPPPDLVIEIDVTHSSLDRLSIYAALGVPEVWRFDGRQLLGYVLDPGGRYQESRQSRAFPFLTLAEVERLLEVRSAHSETDLVRRFRVWVRDRIAAGWQ